MAYIEIVEESTALDVIEEKIILEVGEYTGFTGNYNDLTNKPISILNLERVDNIIKSKNIQSMTYVGGSNSDKLSEITYDDFYSESFYYDANNKLQYVDHKRDGVVVGYTELGYTNDKLTAYTYNEGAR